MSGIIDIKERSIIPYLTDFKVQKLEVGSFIVGTNIVERRTWADCQFNDVLLLCKLAKFKKDNPTYTAILLLEGSVPQNVDKFSHKEYPNIKVIRTRAMNQTIEYIKSLIPVKPWYYKYLGWELPPPILPSKLVHNEYIVKKICYLLNLTGVTSLADHIIKNTLTYKDCIIILMEIPDINMDIAVKLLEYFKLVELLDPIHDQMIQNIPISSAERFGEKRYASLISILVYKF